MTHMASDEPDTTSVMPSFTIRDIQEIHQKLVRALSEANRLCLDIDDEAHVDLSFIQLIESARRHAAENGKVVLLAKPVGANVREVLERSGFLTRPSSEFARFWLHEEVVA